MNAPICTHNRPPRIKPFAAAALASAPRPSNASNRTHAPLRPYAGPDEAAHTPPSPSAAVALRAAPPRGATRPAAVARPTRRTRPHPPRLPATRPLTSTTPPSAPRPPPFVHLLIQL